MSASMEVMPPNGHETMLEAVFNKIKSILPNDENVKQKNYTTYNGEYRLLLSGTKDDTERTECVGKSSHLIYNPWTDEFSILDNATLGVFGSSGVGGLLIRHYDIQFNNSDTWDGTHTSLKDAITYLSSQSAVNKVDKAGDTISGDLDFLGSNVCLKTSGSSSDDSGDIVFYHGNGNEKSRIWSNTEYTSAMGPNYRVYKKDGTSLYSGRLATLNDLSWGNISGKPSSFTPAAHNHGTLHSDFGVTVANTTTDSGWSMINSTYNGFILKTIRFNGSSPAWGVGNFGAGICFGGGDTKGILSCAYGSPSIKIAGGNGTKPVWWIGISGTSGTTYNLNTITNGSARDNTKLPLSGGTVTGATTFSASGDALKTSSGNIYCAGIVRTRYIARYDTGDNNYTNHVNYGNTAYAPVRASAFTTMSCKHTKTNVVDISEEDALKLLDIRPVNFDYVEEVGGQKDQIGVLAEDTYEVLPKVVSMPDDYVEEDFDISKGIHQSLPSVDYAKFVPYLIKLVQIQQKEIDILKSKLN